MIADDLEPIAPSKPAHLGGTFSPIRGGPVVDEGSVSRWDVSGLFIGTTYTLTAVAATGTPHSFSGTTSDTKETQATHATNDLPDNLSYNPANN